MRNMAWEGIKVRNTQLPKKIQAKTEENRDPETSQQKCWVLQTCSKSVCLLSGHSAYEVLPRSRWHRIFCLRQQRETGGKKVMEQGLATIT